MYPVAFGDSQTWIWTRTVCGAGSSGIKEAEVDLNGTKVKVMVAHSLGKARQVLEMIKSGELSDVAFIEIMCCPGGCIGGGQPYGVTDDLRLKRIAGIYEADGDLPIRKSHENPAVNTLYEEFLIEPLGEKSHHLLHTKYFDRKG